MDFLTPTAVVRRMNKIKRLGNALKNGVEIVQTFRAPVGDPPHGLSTQEEPVLSYRNAGARKIAEIFDQINWTRWTPVLKTYYGEKAPFYLFDEGRKYYFEPDDPDDPDDPEIVALNDLLDALEEKDLWNRFRKFAKIKRK